MATDYTSQVYANLTDSQKQLILIKTNVAGFFFDAYLKMTHQSSLTITSHPVQTGTNVNDHAYINPASLTLDIGMSDVLKGIIENQFSASNDSGVTQNYVVGQLTTTRSVTAYKTLLALQEAMLPLQIVTRLKIYQNMLIENIDAPDDVKTFYGLRATVTFKEIIAVELASASSSARSNTNGSTKRGQLQSSSMSDTALSSFEKWLSGG